MLVPSIIPHKCPLDADFEIEFIRVKKAIQILAENLAQSYDATQHPYHVETENYEQSLSHLNHSTSTATPLSDNDFNSINQNQNYETTQQNHQAHNLQNSPSEQSQLSVYGTNSTQTHRNSDLSHQDLRSSLEYLEGSMEDSFQHIVHNVPNDVDGDTDLSSYSGDESDHDYNFIAVRQPVETLPSQQWNSIEEMNSSVLMLLLKAD